MKTVPLFLTAVLLASAAGPASADAHSETDGGTPAIRSWVADRVGHPWAGPAELWIDPAGNDTLTSDAELVAVDGGLDYRWSFRGTPQEGELRFTGNGATWKDSWHQPAAVELEPVRAHGALFAGEYSYEAGTGPDWHWRIKLVQRPDDTVVLLMTNIAPWGEEVRAVRMVFSDVGTAP